MLNHLVEVWASIYSNHAALRTAVEFAHVGGLVGGGGCAIASDRATFLALRQPPSARGLHLRSLSSVHRIVVIGLAATMASGVLLFASDLDTFLYSKIFWIKMGLVALLLVNGGLLLRAEHQAERGHDEAWSRLAWTSGISLALWFLTTLAGAALPNIG